MRIKLDTHEVGTVLRFAFNLNVEDEITFLNDQNGYFDGVEISMAQPLTITEDNDLPFQMKKESD